MATSKPSAGAMPIETAVAVLTQKVDNLLEDAGERREQMTELVRAVSKMAVVEERQSTASSALERAFNSITALGERVRKLEESDPINKLSSSAVQKVVWLVLAGFVGATLTGLLKGNNPPAMIQVAPAAPQPPAQTNSQPINP